MTEQTPPTDEELAQIESTTTDKHLTPGPWDLAYEACDCGGDYPCGHGPYVTGVVTPVPTSIAAERCKRTGEEPRDYDFHRGEIGDFTEADWVLMVSARQNVGTLLAEVRRLRAELATTGGERDCLAMAVLFARQWTPEAPMSLRDGLDEILATMPSASVPPVPAPQAPGAPTTPETAAQALLRAEADAIVAHCPNHGPQDQDGVWMDCHCPVADDMRRRADAPAAAAVGEARP